MNSLLRRKQAFVYLGEYLRLFSDYKSLDENFSILIEKLDFVQKEKAFVIHEKIIDYIDNSISYNPWFTNEFILKAIHSIGESLEVDNMNHWLEKYEFNIVSSNKIIGVVMAGNLPLVGFHDYLCVLLSGHSISAKVSKDDAIFLPLLHQFISCYEPDLESKAIFHQDILSKFDAVIATGSDNTARYFEYYFGKYPSIIRKNRNGIAILNGEESEKDLEKLADDIFMYFGLGCRNVSKLFVPRNFNFKKLLLAFEKYAHLANHNKYANNYDYNKSIFLINKIKFLDNGFVMLKEDSLFSSPISVLYFEYYDNINDLSKWLVNQKDKIQCLVSTQSFNTLEHLPFGKSQGPELWDYADGIDTLEFLLSQN